MLRRSLLLGSSALLGACTSFKFGVANLPTRLRPLQRAGDVAFGAHPRQRLDVYAARNARSAPVVVFWYGGGFTSYRREQYRFVGAALAQRGVVAVLPEYRRFPPDVFPSFVEDAALAVRWVQEHAARYGGDPGKLFLMGHSAGGYLASLVALDRRYLARVDAAAVQIRGVVALSAPHVLDPNSATLRRIFAPPYAHADWQPVRFVTRDAPPFLLMHGTEDRLVGAEQSRRLAERLRQAEVAHELLLLPGLAHEDTVAALSLPRRRSAPVLEKTLRFVQERSAN